MQNKIKYLLVHASACRSFRTVRVGVCVSVCVRETETRSRHQGDSSAGGNSTSLDILSSQ